MEVRDDTVWDGATPIAALVPSSARWGCLVAAARRTDRHRPRGGDGPRRRADRRRRPGARRERRARTPRGARRGLDRARCEPRSLAPTAPPATRRSGGGGAGTAAGHRGDPPGRSAATCSRCAPLGPDGLKLKVKVPDRSDVMPELLAAALDVAFSVRRRFGRMASGVHTIAIDDGAGMFDDHSHRWAPRRAAPARSSSTPAWRVSKRWMHNGGGRPVVAASRPGRRARGSRSTAWSRTSTGTTSTRPSWRRPRSTWSSTASWASSSASTRTSTRCAAARRARRSAWQAAFQRILTEVSRVRNHQLARVDRRAVQALVVRTGRRAARTTRRRLRRAARPLLPGAGVVRQARSLPSASGRPALSIGGRRPFRRDVARPDGGAGALMGGPVDPRTRSPGARFRHVEVVRHHLGHVLRLTVVSRAYACPLCVRR